ncbi:MAG: DUF1730 domain-containing protein, partial [Oscillospiraceae bacterium]
LLSCRAAERIPPNAKTVIVCAFPYYVGEPTPRNISRYAMVQDYHRVAGDLLQTICGKLEECYPQKFAWFVDNSPIREVDAAVRAGLGVKGRHSLLIHPIFGSYLFLGTIVTDWEMDLPKEPQKITCIDCGCCIKACPSQCISTSGVDASKCLSSITQRKGELTPEEYSLVRDGGSLWGCDRCQEVCPMNAGVHRTEIEAFYHNVKPFLTKEDLSALLIKERAYGFRGEKPLIRNYEIVYGLKK